MTHVTREVFWNIPGVFRTVFYASAVLASGLFISGIWVKFSVWLRGKDNPDDIVYGMRGIELARMSLKGLFSKECFFAKRVFEKSRVEFVEIAVEPNFQKEFVQAMHIPHMKDPFPNLKKLLEKSAYAAEIKGQAG